MFSSYHIVLADYSHSKAKGEKTKGQVKKAMEADLKEVDMNRRREERDMVRVREEEPAKKKKKTTTRSERAP